MFFSALVDAPTSAVLMVSTRAPIISYLAETTADTECYYLVNYPHYAKDFGLAKVDPRTYPEWSWNGQERKFQPTAKPLVTDRIRKASWLALKKSIALQEIIVSLNSARETVFTGINLQETVYMTKKLQAQRYKDVGGDIAQYPYVFQYAEFSGLEPTAAADEILFKAQLDDEALLKSEFFRLKYFNLLKDITEFTEVDSMMVQFRQEFRKEI